MTEGEKMRGYSCIALDNPKYDVNVGSALRAAYNYRAAMICASGMRYKRHAADTSKAYRHMPLLCVEDVFDCIPFDCVPVGVDLVPDAKNLCTYRHPERAFYIFGAEDATLGQRILSRCKEVVAVPTDGCMNLAASVNVVLYDRLSKQMRKAQ